MAAADAGTSGLTPQSGKAKHPTPAFGSFAVTPPRAIKAMAIEAAIARLCAMRRLLEPRFNVSPLNVPARMAVVATSAISVIATIQCATVASGALSSFTVTPPSIAAKITVASAANDVRIGPPGPATPGERRARQANQQSKDTDATSMDARYLWLTSTTKSGR